MNHRAAAKYTLFVSLCILASGIAAAIDTKPTAAAAANPALLKAVSDPARSPQYVARDAARHPLEELTFFGLQPNMTVVEVWPGGGYWSEILGPYLKSAGRYYAAVPVRGESAEEDKGTKLWRTRMEAQKDHVGNIMITGLGKGHYEIAPPGSVDRVLTFRNLHNWMEGGYVDDALKACYTALKPGGILGIEDHRGLPNKPQDPIAKSGYVRQDYTIELARKAGFEFVGASEINANPRDTKEYPKGVWTLPPTLALGDQDRDKYVAIGEGDNYVLKFRKPAK